MSTEMHVMMKMLSDPKKLRWIAIPIELSPITSAEGQSKSLIDSAERHCEAIKNIFIDDDAIEDCTDSETDSETDSDSDNDVDMPDDDEKDIQIKKDKKDKKMKKLLMHHLENWIQCNGDGPYCKDGRIKQRFHNYIKQLLNIDVYEWDGFNAWWDDMHRMAIAIKNAMHM